MRVPGVEFQSFDAGKLVAVEHPAPTPAPPAVSRQGEGGGRPTKGCKTCVVCKRSRKAKEKADPARCLTNAAAAVPEPDAFDVKLLKDPADWAVALKGGARTRSKRVRVRVQQLGDQDWVDKILAEMKPPV